MSGQQLKWLHLSDFHVGRDNYAERQMFDRILENVDKEIGRGNRPNYVFITGDIAYDGKVDQYEEFNSKFLRPLKTLIADDMDDRIFSVPGNHDLDRSINPGFSREKFTNIANRYFDPTDEGLALRNMLLPRFGSYADKDETCPLGYWINSPGGAYAQIQEFDGIKVGIVGLNTAWVAEDEYDQGKLTPGKSLLEKALGQIANCRLTFVLGHHPMEWFVPAQRKMIASQLAKKYAIYLHGHLHNAWASPEYGGGFTFLSIQCGAAFQARDDEMWRNGIVWGEADFQRDEISLQPWSWSATHDGWTLAAEAFPDVNRRLDRWIYPIPGASAKAAIDSISSAKLDVPSGWAVATLHDLQPLTSPLESTAAIRFFDGAVPGLHTALSKSIPRRTVVGTLVSHFSDYKIEELSKVAVLLGSSCEGKTTALIQAAYAIVEKHPTWKILRRSDESIPLDASSLLPLLTKTNPWLVVIDDADNAAIGVTDFLQKLPSTARGQFHFLLACRDSDWIAEKAPQLEWSRWSQFLAVRLTGLNQQDAASIVQAWTDFGSSALGALESIPAADRSRNLIAAAIQEAKSADGEFFGALLSVRFGEDLTGHAKLLLDHLAKVQTPGGRSLQDALGLISAMHSEGLEFLSKPTLASALNCPLDRLRRDVLLPLGQEAAATTTSDYVFTRHRRIAKAVLLVLERDLGVEIDALFVRLVEAALNAKNKGNYVPHLTRWRFEMPEYFLEQGRKSLAIELAKVVNKSDPSDGKTVTKLSRLYRHVEELELAASLFENFGNTSHVDRSFFYEWGTVLGYGGDPGGAATLTAYALCDQAKSIPPDNETAKHCLSGISINLKVLFEKYSDMTYLKGRMAAGIIVSKLRLDMRATAHMQSTLKECEFLGATSPTLSEAFAHLQDAIALAKECTISETIAARVGEIRRLTFEGLSRLVRTPGS